MTTLARRLGVFDATMIVMGGIIGSGIFINPSVVARHVHSPVLILGVWIAGGVIALLGALIYAELASARPEAGGQYAYLRDAFHPAVAFLYGWGLLLVVQSGGMAAVAVTFARYMLELTNAAVPDWIVATVTLLLLVIVNCLGVRSGSNTQSALMVLKLLGIVLLVIAGLFFAAPTQNAAAVGGAPLGVLAAMTAVMFAYGGWQTSTFVAAELKNPRRDLVIGLLAGVAGVIAVYVAVNVACLRALGTAGLAQTTTPASAAMRLAFGEAGAKLIAITIAISTLGFLSQGMLTAPRVYYAMANDGLFFRVIGSVHPRTRVPVAAIILQGVVAIVIALSGTYEQILSYVVSTDFLFFGLTGATIFIFRRRKQTTEDEFRNPGHPVTTIIFIAACWLVVIGTFIAAPINSLVGFAILLAGLGVYAWWSAIKAASAATESDRGD